MIPAIIMTGDTTSMSREPVHGVAPCSFCLKPFDCTVIADALAELVDSKTLLAEGSDE
jgi:hypothetical protein